MVGLAGVAGGDTGVFGLDDGAAVELALDGADELVLVFALDGAGLELGAGGAGVVPPVVLLALYL